MTRLLRERWLAVVFVSRQLGHASPAITLEVYAHLFARREHGDLARQALDASYEAMKRGVLTLALTRNGVA